MDLNVSDHWKIRSFLFKSMIGTPLSVARVQR